MFRSLTLLKIGFVILMSSLGNAAASEGNFYHELYLQALQQLSHMGVQRVCKSDLKNQYIQSLKIRTSEVPYVDAKQPDGTYRATAFWSRSRGEISFSQNHKLSANKQTYKWLVAHEFWGIGCGEDGNFSVSGLASTIEALELLTNQGKIQNERSLQIMIDQLKRQLSQPLLLAGGFSGVGGGGDLRPFTYMSMVYAELYYELGNGSIEESQFQIICDRLHTTEIGFSGYLSQGDFRYDSKANSLLIPDNAGSKSNFDLNFNAIPKLIAQLKAVQ